MPIPPSLDEEISEQYESALEGSRRCYLSFGRFSFCCRGRKCNTAIWKNLDSVIQHFQGQFTIPADLAGTPTITVPCGFSGEGSPYAVQFLGARLSELSLCRIAHAYERATLWHQSPPGTI